MIMKSDQLVISLAVGVALVTIYQAGSKIGEMLGWFGSQFHQMISPAAAAMHVRGDESGLRHLLLRISRLTFLLVTPAYLLCAVYLEPLIRVFTGKPCVDSTWWVGQALLLSMYSLQITSGCSKRVLMMCGEQKRLLLMSLAEAAANVLLSVILAYQIGVLGVAVGTMIPTVLVGWLWVIPLTLKKLDLPFKSYVVYHLEGTLRPLAVFTVILTALVVWFPATAHSNLLQLGWRASLCLAPLLLLGRKVIRDMSRA